MDKNPEFSWKSRGEVCVLLHVRVIFSAMMTTRTRKSGVFRRLEQYAGEGSHVAALKSIHFRNPNGPLASSTRTHSHDYYELVIVLGGEGVHWLEAHSFPLAPGQVYLIPPGKKHRYQDFEHLVLQNFMFGRKVFRFLQRQLQVLPGYATFFQEWERQPKLLLDSWQIAEFDVILQGIALENQRGNNQNQLLLTSYMGMLLSKLLDNRSGANSPKPIHGSLQNAVAYMRQNYYCPIPLKKLAELSHMSLSSFHACFRREFHTSPLQWLLRFRVQKAMELLLHTEKSITDVANDCGFSDPLYFSRQFRKLVGFTPRFYRQHGQGMTQIIRGETYQVDTTFLENPLHSPPPLLRTSKKTVSPPSCHAHGKKRGPSAGFPPPGELGRAPFRFLSGRARATGRKMPSPLSIRHGRPRPGGVLPYVGSRLASFTLLYVTVMRERLRPLQAVGLGLCLLGLAMLCLPQ